MTALGHLLRPFVPYIRLDDVLRKVVGLPTGADARRACRTELAIRVLPFTIALGLVLSHEGFAANAEASRLRRYVTWHKRQAKRAGDAEQSPDER